MRRRKPGWAVDPNNENFLRWWDGESWSADTRSNALGPYAQSRMAVKLAPVAIIAFLCLVIPLVAYTSIVSTASSFKFFEVLNDFTVTSLGLIAIPSIMGASAILLDKMSKIPALISSVCWVVGFFGVVILSNYIVFLLL